MRSTIGHLSALARCAALALPLFVIGSTAWSQSTQDSTPGVEPVVVELYTSQGCSSCPPADALLGELAARDDVIALSLHVDYWDYIGWKDTFASMATTSRQRAYGRALKSRYIYTPEMIIDGRKDVVGSRRQDVESLIAEAASRPKPVKLRFEDVNGGRVVIPAGHAPEGGASVWLAIYDGSHEVPIGRGENGGRSLVYHNVVRELEQIGAWNGEELIIPVDLADAAARGRAGCAVIVQQGRVGPVLGAIKMDLDG